MRVHTTLLSHVFRGTKHLTAEQGCALASFLRLAELDTDYLLALIEGSRAGTFELKNVVTRALGGESDVLVDVREFPVEPGDMFLLCSDGLTTMLPDEEIEKHLESGSPPDQICRSLVRDANSRGGLDNITVVLVSAESAADNPALKAFVDLYLSDDGLASVPEVGYVSLPEDRVEATRSAWEAEAG